MYSCWTLHGEPADWKPNREKRGNAVATELPEETPALSFTKDQMDLLQNQALHVTHSPTTSWIVDSGASDHMTGLDLREDDWKR